MKSALIGQANKGCALKKNAEKEAGKSGDGGRRGGRRGERKGEDWVRMHIRHAPGPATPVVAPHRIKDAKELIR